MGKKNKTISKSQLTMKASLTALLVFAASLSNAVEARRGGPAYACNIKDTEGTCKGYMKLVEKARNANVDETTIRQGMRMGGLDEGDYSVSISQAFAFDADDALDLDDGLTS